MSENQYIQSKPWQLALFPLANGVGNTFLVLMMFVSYLAAGGYGIAVTTAGLIVTGSRILDGVTDPIVAVFCDKLNTKFGKVRILLLIGYAIMSLAVISMFFWCVGRGMLAFILCYVFYIIGYTIFNIAQGCANPILTTDPRQRPKIFRWSTIYTTVISTFTSTYMSMVLYPKYGGLSMGAFQEMCITVVLLSGVLTIIAMIAISEKDKPEAFVNVKKTKTSFKDCLNLIKNNRALQTYIVAAASDKLALQAASQSAIVTMVFGIIIGNYSFNGTLNMINLIPTIIVIFFVAKTAGQKGSKDTIVKWTYMSIAVAVVMVAFMCIINPAQISVAVLPTVLFVVIYVAFNALKLGVSVVTGAMIPDIVDYEMQRSGNFMPATVQATYSFVDKLISSFAATIVSFSISFIGYKTIMPQPEDPSSPAIFGMAMFLWMGLPILGWLCTIAAMKFYPLSKEKMEEVQKENYEARKAVN